MIYCNYILCAPTHNSEFISKNFYLFPLNSEFSFCNSFFFLPWNKQGNLEFICHNSDLIYI